jgi:ATP-dependent Clp protease protease subunit
MSDNELESALTGIAPLRVADRLHEARTILISGDVDSKLAQRVTGQLLTMAADSDEPITIFLHSPGGHVESGDTIFDMIRFVAPRVKMVGTGWVASAGTHIYLAVPREDRYCLPNTRFMIHQPLGGVGGQAMDIEIEAEEILKARSRLNSVIAAQTGQALLKVEKDTDRNFWMSPTEAKDYGIVGKIISDSSEL